MTKKIAMVVVMGAAMLVAAGCKKGGDDSAASGGKDAIGVKECDDYVNKYEACINKMGEAQKAAAAPGFKAQRDTFKSLAANSTTKAGLAAQCTAAMTAIKSTCP